MITISQLIAVLTVPTQPLPAPQPIASFPALPVRLTLQPTEQETLKASISMQNQASRQFELVSIGQSIATFDLQQQDDIQVVCFEEVPENMEFKVTSKCQKTGESWTSTVALHPSQDAPCTIALPTGCVLELEMVPKKAEQQMVVPALF